MDERSPEEKALLAAIRAEPESDEPRLIYADWLEEHGYPRSEFIRMQIELEDQFLPEKRRGELQERESVLLTKCREAWEQPLRQLGAREVYFRRGFPEGVAMSVRDYLANAEQLHAIAPITSLQINKASLASIQELTQSPHLAKLTTLDLRGNRIGDEGARAIAASPHLANLTTLDLCNNYISEEGARAIAASPHLANLTMLDLRNNYINEEGARAIAASPHLANLTMLDLRNNHIGEEGARAIAASAHLAKLTTLDLCINHIGEEGARAIAASPHLANLTTLDLHINHIGDAGAQALVTSPHLANTTLNLKGNPVGSFMLAEIARHNARVDERRGRNAGRSA